MAFSVISSVSAIQSAVSTRLSEWTGAFASNILGQVQDLSHWENAGMPPPATLSDLAHPRTAVSLLLNPHFAQSVCRIIGVDARAVIGRETRSNRLLPNLNSPSLALTLTDHLHSVPSAKIVLLLQKHPGVRLFIARENRPETRLPASMISILLMAVKEGENVTFRAEGEGRMEVLLQIQKLNIAEWSKGDRKASRVEIRDIYGADVNVISREILQVMRDFEQDELAAVYHPKTGRFVVGHILSTHREIAKTAGLGDYDSYLRLNLDGRRGRLQACFAPGKDEENKAGRDRLQKWLEELFNARPI